MQNFYQNSILSAD